MPTTLDPNQTVPTVALGTDYLQTDSSGTSFNFGGAFGLNQVNFKGDPTDFLTSLPVGPGATDTKIERLNDAVLNSGTINIKVAAVSLQSVSTVTIGGDSYEIFAYLDPSTLTNDVGTMAIAGYLTGGTFTNQFTVDLAFTFQDLTNPGSSFDLNHGNGNDVVKVFTGSGNWQTAAPAGDTVVSGPDDGSAADQAANVHTGLDANEVDFFISGSAVHDTGGGQHTVTPAANVVCYTRGTRVLTDKGEIPIEDLRTGDLVVTLSSGRRSLAAVKWLGRRRINLTLHPTPALVAPIRIRRDAFAENAPHRDLLVSPDHAINTDGVLICARLLINGASIARESGLDAEEYFHLELDEHAILFAENLTAESYLDTGNRGLFANGAQPLILHPDLSGEAAEAAREAGSCAPFLTDPEPIHAIWRRLADRADVLGMSRPIVATTDDPGLVVLANGRLLRPVQQRDDLSVFCLSPGITSLRLVSRAAAASATRPWIADPRVFGVAVSRIVMRDLVNPREVPVDHPGLQDGWWAVESDGAAIWRWTNGNAELPPPAKGRACMLEIHSRASDAYPREREDDRLGAAAA